MKLIRNYLFYIMMLIFASPIGALAQDNIENADAMHQNGKIYVVIAVIALLFLGLVIWLITQEIRINKLKKLINNRN